jgi:hypothetical protein
MPAVKIALKTNFPGRFAPQKRKTKGENLWPAGV